MCSSGGSSTHVVEATMTARQIGNAVEQHEITTRKFIVSACRREKVSNEAAVGGELHSSNYLLVEFTAGGA